MVELHLSRASCSLLFMISLPLGIHSSEFNLYFILEFALYIEFLRIFVGYSKEFEAGSKFIENCFELANNIAVEILIFKGFFHLKGNFNAI